MALDPKDEAVLRDGMLACGFTMPPHQLRTLMDFNAPATRWTEAQWSLLASRLRSDRREMDAIHAEALRFIPFYKIPLREPPDDMRMLKFMQPVSYNLMLHHVTV